MTELDRGFLKSLRQASSADRVLTDPAECLAYGMDNARQAMPAGAVVFADNHDEVEAIIRSCHQHRKALVCRGRGTNTAGAAVPLNDAVVLSLENMNRVLELDPDNRFIRVQTGITNLQVQQQAAATGLFWPPDPTSAAACTVGGNLAMNAAGPRAVKYGTTRDNVLGLRAVNGEGQGFRSGVMTTKGVVGYDLTRLLIGSEGTLAVITEATLQLRALPESKHTLRVLYSSIDAAAHAIARIMRQSITPCALELMDAAAIDIVRQYSDQAIPAEAKALLMIEVDGSAATIHTDRQAVEQAARGPGLIELVMADSPDAIEALWQMRKSLSPALRKLAPGKINEDVVVPVTRIPELVGGLQALSDKHLTRIVNFGHAGNGNLHVNLLFDSTDEAATTRARACLQDTFRLVLQLGGTLSGEHGIGLVKRNFVGLEIEPAALMLMRQIKQQFDPKGILNPGKVFPD